MTIKIREPSAAFLRQVEVFTPRVKKQRPWREFDDTDNSEHQVSLEGVGETEDKLETKLGQTEDNNQSQTEAKLESNQSQTRAKLESNQSQTEPGPAGLQTETRATTRAKSKPNWSQTGAKLEPNWSQNCSLINLPKLQAAILDYLYAECKFHGGSTTDPIRIEDLLKALKGTPSSIKKAIQRMISDHYLIRKEMKVGRNGWTRYLIPEPVYKELGISETRAKLKSNQSQTRAKLEPQLEPQLEPTSPSSSSYINNNFKPTTTAETRACEEDVWSPEDVDYSMLTEIGFGRSQVLQLRSLGISFDVVQRSLVYFEFEYRHTPSGKTIQEPLGLLMKRMRQNGCWPAPEEYTKRHAHFHSRFGESETKTESTEHQGAVSVDVGGENFETP